MAHGHISNQNAQAKKDTVENNEAEWTPVVIDDEVVWISNELLSSTYKLESKTKLGKTYNLDFKDGMNNAHMELVDYDGDKRLKKEEATFKIINMQADNARTALAVRRNEDGNLIQAMTLFNGVPQEKYSDLSGGRGTDQNDIKNVDKEWTKKFNSLKKQ